MVSQEVLIGEGTFTVNQQLSIVSTTESNNTANILQTHIKKIAGYQIDIIESEKPNHEVIQFKLNKC